MALYNIFGTSEEWDEATIGYLRTIEVDRSKLVEALRFVAKEDLLDSDDDERADEVRMVDGREGMQEMLDENEASWPFAGSLDDVVAYAELNRGDFYSRIWLAIPCEVATILTGDAPKSVLRAAVLDIGEAVPQDGKECWISMDSWTEAGIVAALRGANLISEIDAEVGDVGIRDGIATISFPDGAPSCLIIVREECLRPI